MIRNFFTTAIRTMLKNKAYAVINFIGLTCGLALALLIITYVRSEISYDRFHAHADRLYRLRYTAPNGLELASTPPPIAPAMKEHFAEVEETARVYGRNVSITLPGKTEAFEETDVYFADSALVNMFTFQLVHGTLRRALHDKFTILINEEMAKKYFGNENPVGESLIFSGRHAYKITGVVKNFPEHSHLRFNILAPYDNMFDLEDDQTADLLRKNLAINFIISHSYTYVLLKPHASAARVDAGMKAFLEKYAQPRFLVGQVFALMPVPDIHLHSTLLVEPSPTNTMANLYIFMGVGLLTLVIACINYINLSTAQSLTRVKEIGIRKILGSMKYQLIVQFLAESFLFVGVSMAIAYVAFYFALPLMNQLTGKTLLFATSVDAALVAASVALLVFITALAGGYPAYFVTRFESVSALKGNSLPGSSRQVLRKALVVFQLAIASMLLCGSLLIMKQMNFLATRPLGFQRQHVVNVPLFSQNLNGLFRQTDSTFRSRLQTFRTGVEAQAGVTQTTLSSGAPGLGVAYRGTIPEGFTQEDNLFIANMSVDYDFLQAYGMALVAGRGFSRDYGTDEAEGFVVNESAVKEFNWGTPAQAIGKTLDREGKKGKIIGVVKDFNFASLAAPISAMVLELDADQFGVLSVKFENQNVQATLEAIEVQWNKIFPEKAFEFTFLDEQLNAQYTSDRNFGTIIQVFTGIGILIACLGVYGLVLFTVQRKVKEIGVRKVLGATIASILRLIGRDFAVLIVIAFVLAVPASYYFLDQWLANFIYRTDIDAATYGISFMLIAAVVMLTIGYQAIRAARANPVTSLRSE